MGGGMGVGGGAGVGPVNPRILRGLAYTIFGVVGLATILFSIIIAYLCTAVTLT